MPLFRHLTAFCLLLLVAACARAPEPRPVVLAPPPVLSPDAACLHDLSALHVQFEPMAPFGDPDQGCGIENPVKVSDSGTTWNRPSVVTCDMARTIAQFDRNVLQPTAWTRFGQPIAKVIHAGTYDCRIRRNGTTQAAAGSTKSKGGRLSEHAKGRAIDIMGFELADGTRISVKKDWRGQGVKSTFLQDIARGSCSSFNVVLTPNHDRLHQDHLHLDTGPYTLCGY